MIVCPVADIADRKSPLGRGTRAGFRFGKSRGKNFRPANLRLSPMFLARTKLYRCVGCRTEMPILFLLDAVSVLVRNHWFLRVQGQARMSHPLKPRKIERPRTQSCKPKPAVRLPATRCGEARSA